MRSVCLLLFLPLGQVAVRVSVATLCYSHGLRLGFFSLRSMCFSISCVPNFLNYFPTVITAPTIINCLRGRQFVAFQARFSWRYSTPFDNPSNVGVTMRGFGTATKAGSNSHMYAGNGDRSCSHRLHDYTYGSSSRSTGLEERLRYDVSHPCQ